MFYEEDLYEVIDHYGDTIYVCSYCRDNNYTYCEYDEQYHPSDECSYVENYGYVYDGDIDGSDFAQCEDCGELVYIGYGSEDYAYVEGYGVVCSDCLNNGDYFQCADCGDWFLSDGNEHVDEESGDSYCSSCFGRLLEKREIARRNAEQAEQNEHAEEVAA